MTDTASRPATTTDRSAPIRFVDADEVPADAEVLGVPVFDDLTLPVGAGARLDVAFLRRCGFEGRPGQARAVPADDGTTVVALGVGKGDRVDGDVLRRAGAALARHAGAAAKVATTLPAAAGGMAAPVVEGFALGSYRFEDGRRRVQPRAVEQLTVVGARADDVRRGAVAAEATARARDWVNTPARDLTPTRLGALTEELARERGLRVEVWDERRIAAEGLGGLGGVAAGAVEPARLIKLEYRPRSPRARVALVGKGITFDSGGLSLKTAAGMMTMKSDMGGAAAVINATLAAADLALPVAVTAWVSATENMPSGTAIRPGDVLVARNGTTIEVLNTDAEGRLVLADALSLAVEEEPDAIVDVATLTGGQRVALGSGVAAVLANDDALAAKVTAAGDAAGEPAWRLPLVAAYRKRLDSEVADIKNVTTGAAEASTIIAALFLEEFVDGRSWAHLDIAAPSWSDSDEGLLTKGGTGWGTRTLIEMLAAWA
ncbi:leucyl aminopeptidase [Acidiferrimicrobium sp. IK]|uniref:leucyl aminopeptidase n=1 Tax=Acidiferrimicrobium sp. IK TaxID=2871700 RepID=UPI0021CB3E82|nr:leucyl aminopeptidase [Acidiferrimicrobium sp. IK]MCU4184301.1 leucyl aminopeptidase [Acidiferrimicrobium sp. IK]